MTDENKHQDTTQNGSGSVKQSGKKPFDIPEMVKQKYPNLIPLIMATESMNDEERQYWFHILPIMTPEQVKKFEGILVNEKQQLEKLNHEYDAELKKLNQKSPSAADIYKTREKQKQMKAQEAKHEVEEKAKEEDILKRLDEV